MSSELEVLAQLLREEVDSYQVRACGGFAGHPLARDLGFTRLDTAAMGLYPELWLNPVRFNTDKPPDVQVGFVVSADAYKPVHEKVSQCAYRETTYFDIRERIDTFEFKSLGGDVVYSVSLMPGHYISADEDRPDPNWRALYMATQESFVAFNAIGIPYHYEALERTGNGVNDWPEELRQTRLPAMFSETYGHLLWVEQMVQAMFCLTGLSLGQAEILHRRLVMGKLEAEEAFALLESGGCKLEPWFAQWLEQSRYTPHKCRFAYEPFAV